MHRVGCDVPRHFGSITSFHDRSHYCIAASAERAVLPKHIKYVEIRAANDFVPVAIETLGPINSDGTA